MKLVEFRIPLPMTVEEFQVGLLYTVAVMSREKTNKDTSVRVLINEPFENERGRGQYTHKLYEPGSKVPAFLQALFSPDYFSLEEKAWNCYPYCRTEYTFPCLGNRFSAVVESIHLPDNGTTENAHNLTPEQLKLRKVRVINIATDSGSESSAESDPKRFRSEKTGRGPLSEGWIEEAQPVLCCYKLARINIEIPLLTSKCESFFERYQADIFLEFARQTFIRLDDWFGMTMEDVRVLEAQVKEELEEKLAAMGKKLEIE